MAIINDAEWSIFASNIAFLRKKNGLSKRKMAKNLGIGVGSLTKIENGELPERLRADIIWSVYKNFGIRPSDQFASIFKD